MTDVASMLDMLEKDPAVSDVLLQMVITAWPSMNNKLKVRIVEQTLTPEWRAEIARRAAHVTAS